MKQILIIASEQNLITALNQSLCQMKVEGQATVLRSYPSMEQLRKLVRAKSISAVIIDLSQLEPALQLITELHQEFPELAITASHTVNSVNPVLAAIRAGASEYFGPPFEVQELERILLNAGTNSGKTKPGGRLIGLLPALGGSGASTVALHLAATMARESKKKILLIDFDFHSSAVELRLRLKPEFTLVDAIRRSDSLDELWSRLTCRWKEIDVLAPPPLDYPLHPEELGRTSNVFTSALRTYDWVICDLPAAVYSSCSDVLVRAEAIYLVCTPELSSLHHARRKVQQLRDLGLAREALRLVVNRADWKLSPTEVGNIVGVPVARALRNDYAAVNSAYMKGCPVPEDSVLGKQFRDFAQQIMGVQTASEPATSWKKKFSRIGAGLRGSSRRETELPRVVDPSPAQ